MERYAKTYATRQAAQRAANRLNELDADREWVVGQDAEWFLEDLNSAVSIWADSSLGNVRGHAANF
jgi:hypothetical protein